MKYKLFMISLLAICAGCGDTPAPAPAAPIKISTRFVQIESIYLNNSTDPAVVKDTKTGRLYLMHCHGGIIEVNEKPLVDVEGK